MQNSIAQTEVVWTLMALDGHARIRIGADTLVGRSAACQLHLVEPEIADEHARLTVEPDGLWLTDLRTDAGTFLNGIRISGSVNLVSGDEISFGPVGFEVRSGASIMNLNKPIPLRVTPVRPTDDEVTERLQLTLFEGEIENEESAGGSKLTALVDAHRREIRWKVVAAAFAAIAAAQLALTWDVIVARIPFF